MFFIILILSMIFSTNAQLNEGDACIISPNYEDTTCKLISSCPYAKNLLKKHERPKLCGFKGKVPIVCCKEIGELTNRMCFRYNIGGNNGNAKYKGIKTTPKEFTHMANLGYEDGNETKWLCGGSLVSDSFILTAAHCIYSSEFGPVKWIRVGDLDLNNSTDDAQPQDIKVKQTFIHPEYKPPSHYHDIALIKLENKVIFNEYIRPACIYTTKVIPEIKQLISTGWGKTDFAGDTSSHLLKIEPNIVSFDRCAKLYNTVSKRKLAEGIRDDIQICAGHEDGRDACQGDSGGPLQIKVDGQFRQYYEIVGITSFGKSCGVTNSAGVYVRVFPYIDWIEEIVWTD